MPSRPLDEAIATARRERDEAERKLRILLDAQRALLDETVAATHGNEVLRNQHNDARLIDTMNAILQVRGQRLGTKHIGAVRMRRVDGSVAKFAERHGYRATTVRSWYAAGDAARKIPRVMAEKLALPPYKIPPSAWVNGIED